ncbi:MAG: aminodeoxychorismate/anthranilate synthase component II [Candidatus Korarchaeum sp.]
MRVLVIDNYDSFVYNLVQYLGELGAEPLVYRNDIINVRKAQELKPDRIVISPGPGSPEDPRYFGSCAEILRSLSKKIPTLGVCLGHQGIVWSYGGSLVKARRIMHGKASLVEHDGKGLFRGLKNPILAARYHSLVVDKERLPSCFIVTAVSLDDGEIMGVRHLHYPIEGVQFHPESVLTEQGKMIIKNFLDGW